MTRFFAKKEISVDSRRLADKNPLPMFPWFEDSEEIRE